MWLLFKAAAEWVGPLQELFDGLFTSSDEGAFSVANLLGGLFAATGLGGGWLEKLVINGLVTRCDAQRSCNPSTNIRSNGGNYG